MPDGKITFSTDLDNKGAEKKLDDLTKKIESAEKELFDKKEQQSSIKTELESASKEAKKTEDAIADLNAQISEMESIRDNFGIEHPFGLAEAQASLKEQKAILTAQNREVERLDAKYTKITDNVMKSTDSLNSMKAQATEISEQIEIASKNQSAFGDAVKATNKKFDSLLSRISRLVSRVFVFSMITSGLRHLRDWMGNVIKNNDEASASIARLKGAFLTMMQPLVSVVIPAFKTLVNLLTAIVGNIAAFISALGGKTVKQSADAAKALNKQAGALGGVGDAAEDAKKQLMGFDEINKLESTDAGVGGGSVGSGDIHPDFDWTDGISETLDKIADLVLVIGTGFALWKISQMIPGTLGNILGNLGLILAAFGGILLMWDGMNDAWENGVDWGNMTEMLVGLAVAAGALYLAFGPMVAGIALAVGGIALLIVAFHDIMENGFDLQNTLLAIAGIFAAGLGISIFLGSWIPLLIAGIASILLAFTVATGHGEELLHGLKKVCQGFLDFLTFLFSGNMEKAMSGLKTMFSGFGDVGRSVLSGLKDAFWSFLAWLDDATGGVVTNAINMINSAVSWLVDKVNALGSLVSSITGGRYGWSIDAPQIQIPHLAQGAVIPPNREFMAVLGDQTHGNNIEAPEDLIRKIVREETARNGGDRRVAELLEILISVVEGINVGYEVIGKAAQLYNQNMSRARGW